MFQNCQQFVYAVLGPEQLEPNEVSSRLWVLGAWGGTYVNRSKWPALAYLNRKPHVVTSILNEGINTSQPLYYRAASPYFEFILRCLSHFIFLFA